MSGAQALLLLVGALFEFLGIILVASPDLIPQGIRFSRWLRSRTRPISDRIRWLFARRTLTVKVHAAAEMNVAGRASVMKSVGIDATLERKVEFLLTRDQEVQQAVNAIRDRIEDLEIASSKRLDESRRDIEAGFARELKIALESYLPLRICGAIALSIGLVCMTLANFVR